MSLVLDALRRREAESDPYRRTVLDAPSTATRSARPWIALVAIGLLKKQGHTVTVAENGRQALEQLDRGTFDLVLMDVQMPGMDGFEATRVIRTREAIRGGHVPIIALTAKAMKEDRQKCIDAGATDYLSKPVDQDRLLSLLRVWLCR